MKCLCLVLLGKEDADLWLSLALFVRASRNNVTRALQSDVTLEAWISQSVTGKSTYASATAGHAVKNTKVLFVGEE